MDRAQRVARSTLRQRLPAHRYERAPTWKALHEQLPCKDARDTWELRTSVSVCLPCTQLMAAHCISQHTACWWLRLGRSPNRLLASKQSLLRDRHCKDAHLCAASTVSYTARWGLLKRPDTGQVRVTSDT